MIKIKGKVYILTTYLLMISLSCMAQDYREVRPFPVLEGPYLGQEAPCYVPEIFAPGIVSTSGKESSCTFSPDGKTLVFGYGGPSWGIVYMEEIDGQWSEPKLAPFSGDYWDFDFNFRPNGNQLLFSSSRFKTENRTSNIWFVNKNKNGWSEEKNIGYPLNKEKDDHHPSATKQELSISIVIVKVALAREIYIDPGSRMESIKGLKILAQM